MLYKELVDVYEKISKSSKRLDKTYYISELIKKTDDENLEMVLLLLKGELYPSWDKKEIGVANRMVLKAIGLASGISIEDVEKEWKKSGDLGKTAGKVLSNRKQATLFSHELTVKKVFNDLRKLAEIDGEGSVDHKSKIISGLISSANSIEARYIIRTVLEDLRVGVGEGTIRDAIVWAIFPKVQGIFYKCKACGKWMPNTKNCLNCETEIDTKNNSPSDNHLKIEFINEMESRKNELLNYESIECSDDSLSRECYNFFVAKVQEAYDIANDFSTVAIALRKDGFKGLNNIEMKPGKPIKVMLYQKAKSIEDAFIRVGKPAALEYKYDGFRVQIHKYGLKVRIFTRRLEEVTSQFPEVKEIIEKNVIGESFIFDAEVVGYDSKTKKYLPFQSISQRIKRKYDIEKLAHDYPVELNIFDALMYNGKTLITDGFLNRRKIIENAVKEEPYRIVVAKQIITGEQSIAEEFYHQSLAAGEEGIMVKNLKAPYKPGSRVGYGVKVKPVMETLDLVIVKAEWGKGKRAGWLSSFTLACLGDDGILLEIGKVGTGIKEKEAETDSENEKAATFEQMTEILKPLIINEEGTEVRVKPKMVVEINYEEIQKSPSYSSGYALRFPRLVRIREDKPLDEISTISFVEELYENQ